MQKKIKIGLDFDDVIIDTTDAVIDTLGLFFNEVYNIESITQYNIADSLWLDQKIVNDAIDVTLTNEEFSIVKDSGAVIKWLSQFYDLYIVTSRHKDYLPSVNTILERNGILDYIKLSISSDDKIDIFNYLKINTIIEDRSMYIKSASELGFNTLVYDKPWNRKINNTDRTQRVYNWKDIKDYFIIKLGGKHGIN